MSIPKGHSKNFQTMIRAAKAGRLALMECKEAESGAIRYVICAVSDENGEYVFKPFGHLHEGNPYDFYLPPNPNGGFYTMEEVIANGEGKQ